MVSRSFSNPTSIRSVKSMSTLIIVVLFVLGFFSFLQNAIITKAVIKKNAIDLEHPTFIDHTVHGLVLDGVQDYIQLSNTNAWNLDSFSMEVIFKITNLPPKGVESCIISHGDWNGRMQLTLQADASIKTVFKFADNAVVDLPTQPLQINDSAFHQVVITYRASFGEFAFYLDGSLQYNKFFKENYPLAVTENHILLGRCQNPPNFLSATIYSFKIWDTTLQFSQVRKNLIGCLDNERLKLPDADRKFLDYDHNVQISVSDMKFYRTFGKVNDNLLGHYTFHKSTTDARILVTNEVTLEEGGVVYNAKILQPNELNPLSIIRDIYIPPDVQPVLHPLEKKISIIIPMHNTFASVQETLTSVIHSCFNLISNMEIILVEYKLKIPQHILTKWKNTMNIAKIVKMIPMNDDSISESLSTVLNKGIAQSIGHYVIILDDGAVPMKYWLEELLSNFERDPTVGLAGAKLLYPNGKIFSIGLELKFNSPGIKEPIPHPYYRLRGYPQRVAGYSDYELVDAVPYHCMIIKRDVLKKVHGFNIDLDTLFRDSDFSYKVSKLGYKIITVPKSTIFIPNPSISINAPLLYLESDSNTIPNEQIIEQSKKINESFISDDISCNWIMHCGGSMGFEAMNMLYGLENLVDLRTGIRNYRNCEHTNTIGGLPISMQETLDRTIEKSKPKNKFEISIYHRDYRDLGRWVPEHADYVIGRYMFETNGLQKPWVENCNKLDEIWVPGKVFIESFKKDGVKKDIFVIPEAIDTRLYDPEHTEPLPSLSLIKKGYTFLSVFKLEERKGWKVLLRAFFEEFSNERDYDKVTLALRTYIYNDPDAYNSKKIYNLLIKYAEEIGVVNKKFIPTLIPIGEHLPSESMPKLFRAADAFVLPTHSEGWGLPIHEAMAMGLPAIVTGWGGNMEFMNEENSFPIKVESMVDTPFSDPWLRGFKWAMPSVTHLRAIMRKCYENPEFCKQRGQIGRESVIENFSIPKVAQIIKDRLVAIREKVKKTNYQHPIRRDFEKTFLMSTDFISCVNIPLSEQKLLPSTGTRRVLIISTFPPTKCSIGTFTWDLTHHGFSKVDNVSVEVIAMVEDDTQYYDKNMFNKKLVKKKIRQRVVSDYIDAANYINKMKFDLVIIEHEFDIFKGPFIICLARSLKVPLITTFHTVKKSLGDEEHTILHQLFIASQRIIVMTNTMKKILDTHHALYGEKIQVVPHGVRNTDFPNRDQEKKLFGLSPSTTVLTGFGLIHNGNGYEHVIKAMPAILKRHPDTVFNIHGKPHPTCMPVNSCIEYLETLKKIVSSLNLEKNVIFNEKFLDDQQLDHVLGATDIFVTPYTDSELSVSGYVALAMSRGCVVASSSYHYANEVLRDDAGVIFQSLTEDAVAKGILSILESKDKMNSMAKKSYQITRKWVWETVARQMLDIVPSFNKN